MGKPDGAVALFTILYLIGAAYSFRNRKNGMIKAFIWCIVSLVIYQMGISHFFEEVKNASHHGNTIHGWYAKGNGYEKAIATLWVYFFPIGTNAILFYILFKFNK